MQFIGFCLIVKILFSKDSICQEQSKNKSEKWMRSGSGTASSTHLCTLVFQKIWGDLWGDSIFFLQFKI